MSIDLIIALVYRWPIYTIVILMIIAVMVVGSVGAFVNRRYDRVWRIINLCFMFVFIFIAMYSTVLSRSATETKVALIPFASFIRARQINELYRENFMNCFLFFPIGLFGSQTITQFKHLVILIVLGCVISVGIEFTQLLYSLGYVETDDVIMNTLGVLIGSSAFIVRRGMLKAVGIFKKNCNQINKTQP